MCGILFTIKRYMCPPIVEGLADFKDIVEFKDVDVSNNNTDSMQLIDGKDVELQDAKETLHLLKDKSLCSSLNSDLPPFFTVLDTDEDKIDEDSVALH